MSKSKGVREYQLIVNYFLTIDYLRGATYGQLAKRYKLDAANIYKRVNGKLNAEKVTNSGKYPFSRNSQFKRDPSSGRFTIGNTRSIETELGNSI